MAAPQTWPLGISTWTLSPVASSVVKSVSPFTEPARPATSTASPTRNGRNSSSMTPAARFDSVPCSARPTAREAAPSTAMMLVVWMPKRCSTATPDKGQNRVFGEAADEADDRDVDPVGRGERPRHHALDEGRQPPAGD